MATIHITKDNFEQEIAQSDIPVIIDFWASWCMPCQMMGPVFEDLSNDFTGKVKFAKVNTEEQQEVAAAFGVRSIPTLTVMHNNKIVDQIFGFSSKETLKEKVETILKKIK